MSATVILSNLTPPPPLTVDELREAKKQLELNLQAAIAPLLRDFGTYTGVQASAVGVSFQRLWPIEDPKPRHVVIGVSVDLDL